MDEKKRSWIRYEEFWLLWSIVICSIIGGVVGLFISKLNIIILLLKK